MKLLLRRDIPDVGLAGDVVEMEQYMDFLRLRTFRRTLLVHAAQPVNHWISAARLQTLWVTSPARLETNAVPLGPGAAATFVGSDNARLSLTDPLSKAALLCQLGGALLRQF